MTPMQRKSLWIPRVFMLAALTSTALLAGCVQNQPPIYQWDGYHSQIYSYFKGDSKEAQIAALEEGLQKIQAKNGAVPPGYHAQLGMLYMETGKSDQMAREFEAEKTLFPESTQYMDFLLKNAKNGSTQ